ncbi:hypothetical protein DNK59_11480 [Pseudomonas sp. TKO26]|nr:hypothetical protein DNK62_11480 [Pseudomonas sp. TKO30]PYY90006.1 hypothetical protein DNK61_11475 [Pseudomonas sp. TKO29]PYY93094.1 hypothetical protein DNK59_11480 [Pseudomonas sp. TKO26]PYZ00224.1 hypothetical protein DNK60_11475 [Pseudomonas sp. TKO14]
MIGFSSSNHHIGRIDVTYQQSFSSAFYGGCAQGTFGCAGFQCDRSANLRTAATPSFSSDSWQLHSHWSAP